MSRRGAKVPHAPRSFIVPRNVGIRTPARLALAASPLRLRGVDQQEHARSFSAASWGTELAPLILSCVMVSSVRLHVVTVGRLGMPSSFFLSPRVVRVVDLRWGMNVSLSVQQQWRGEVLVWPMKAEPCRVR